jgi:signal transduction histidine kinase
MKRFILFFPALFFIITTTSDAQNKKTDSLKVILVQSKNDSLKLNALNQLCSEYSNSDTANAGLYCRLMLKEAGNTKYLYEKADAYRTAGSFFNIIANYEKALEFYKNAISLFGRIKGEKSDIGYGKTLYSYGSVLHFSGDFKGALSLYLEAETKLKSYKEYNSLLNLYSNISDIYLKTNELEKADECVNKINLILDKITDPVVKCRYYISRANSFVYDKKYSEAIKYFDLVYKIAGPEKRFNILSSWAYNMGFMLSQQNKFDEALQYYTKSMNYARSFGSKYDEYDAMYKIGLMHYYARRFDKANSILLEALKNAESIKSKLLIRNIYDGLTYMEADRGNYKLAYDYLSKYVDLNSEIYSENDRKQINLLNARYETAQKEARIKSLSDEEKIQSLEIEKRGEQIFWLIALSVLLTVTAFIIHRYYKNKKKIAEQDLLIQEQKIKELEKEKQLASVYYALEGEEKERSRLARDLHDGLGGLLSGAKMSFNSFKESYVINSEQADSFTHALGLLNKSITELQRVAHNMMPQAILTSGLKDAVTEFCDSINTGAPISVKFQFFGIDKKISYNYEIAIYRIIQELVNNILKHSKATEAIVQLVQEEERICITVQDNGTGFDTANLIESHGHGLNNIRLRVESLNGHYEISSNPGAGTEVTIEFSEIK